MRVGVSVGVGTSMGVVVVFLSVIALSYRQWRAACLLGQLQSTKCNVACCSDAINTIVQR